MRSIHLDNIVSACERVAQARAGIEDEHREAVRAAIDAAEAARITEDALREDGG